MEGISRQEKAKKRVYISKFNDQENLKTVMAEGLDFIGLDAIVPKDARVAIKPNLTWLYPSPGVTVTPAAIEALVTVLKSRTSKITICESD